MSSLKAELAEVGLSYHEEIDPAPQIDLLGRTLDLKRKKLMVGRRRLWRLWLALDELLARPFFSGRQMRVVVGHLVDAFCLRRELLAVLCHTYVFIGRATDEVRRIPASVSDELLVARDVLMLCVADLGREPLDWMYCSDASGVGYAAHQSSVSTEEFWSFAQFRERWRFKPKLAATELEENIVGASPEVLGYAPRFHEWAASELEAEAWELHDPRRAVASGRAGEGIGARQPRPIEEDDAALPPLPDSVVAAARWELVCSRRWKAPVRIHHGEAFAALVGLRREAAVASSHNALLVSLGLAPKRHVQVRF